MDPRGRDELSSHAPHRADTRGDRGQYCLQGPTATIILTAWIVAAAFWPAVRIPFEPGRWALAIVAIVLAAAIRFLNGYATGLLAFWTTRATALVELQFGISLFLSGRIAPLSLLPPRVAHVAEYLWFPYVLSFPVQVLTGTRDHGRTVRARLCGPGDLARDLADAVSAHLVARAQALRCGGRMTSIRRTIIVLRAFWQLNWLEELQYRGNFIASLLGTVFWLLMAFFMAALYFQHTSTLGGWEFWDVVVLLGILTRWPGGRDGVAARHSAISRRRAAARLISCVRAPRRRAVLRFLSPARRAGDSPRRARTRSSRDTPCCANRPRDQRMESAPPSS